MKKRNSKRKMNGKNTIQTIGQVIANRQFKNTIFQMIFHRKKELLKNILSDFLRENKAEAIAVSIFEYDEEKELRLLRETEREYGIEIGEERGRAQGLTVLVRNLKEFLSSFELVYAKVISNEEYQNVTEEEVRKIFEQSK